MTDKQEMFDVRYRKVLERHRQLSRGYATRLGQNGVISHHPIGQFRHTISLKALFFPLGILFFLKACIFTVLGGEAYDAQVLLLQGGGLVNQIGSFFMQMDPISGIISQILIQIIG